MHGVDAVTDDSKKSGLKLSDSDLNEKNRIENEWSFKRLRLTRRIIFEKFVKNPMFKEYFVKLKKNKSSSHKPESEASNAASNYSMYNYISWSMTNLKEYYYGKSKCINLTYT